MSHMICNLDPSKPWTSSCRTERLARKENSLPCLLSKHMFLPPQKGGLSISKTHSQHQQARGFHQLRVVSLAAGPGPVGVRWPRPKRPRRPRVGQSAVLGRLDNLHHTPPGVLFFTTEPFFCTVEESLWIQQRFFGDPRVPHTDVLQRPGAPAAEGGAGPCHGQRRGHEEGPAVRSGGPGWCGWVEVVSVGVSRAVWLKRKNVYGRQAM